MKKSQSSLQSDRIIENSGIINEQRVLRHRYAEFLCYFFKLSFILYTEIIGRVNSGNFNKSRFILNRV